MTPITAATAALALVLCVAGPAHGGVPFKFDLTAPQPAYDAAKGSGWEPGADVKSAPEGATADRAFSFSARVPEGAYRVRVTLDGATSVKTETRQLQVLGDPAAAGRPRTVEFLVAVRTPAIAGGDAVKIKDREKGLRRWDDKLTLEFCGPGRSGGGGVVSAIEIEPAPADARVVLLVGDSTVCDQGAEPWASWGQMLPVMIRGAAVANHAESGESFRSFIASRRWKKVQSELKPGDLVLFQMGHNVQKDKSPGAGAMTTYKAFLEQCVAEARAKGATPVVLTPVHRRRFEGGKVANSLGEFPAAARKVAEEQKVALIDLNALSEPFYNALGPDGSAAAFVDGTHHNNYGAYELARCVAAGLAGLEGSRALVVPAYAAFDPAKPDPAATLKLPLSLDRDPTKPEGN